MKKLTLSILFLLFSASFCAAQTCDCKRIPLEEGCFRPCAGLSILVNSILEELIIVAGLKKETAQKIVDYNRENRENKVKTIEDYKMVIKNDEFKVFEEKLQSLNENQITYFQTPIKNRKVYRKQLIKTYEAITALNMANQTIVITTQVKEQ